MLPKIEKNQAVSLGVAHLRMLDISARATLAASNQEVFSKAEVGSALWNQLDLIGTCLGTIYEVATCNQKCWGGPHVFEALFARVYNLAASARFLAIRGYYDESLNLIRSVGEAANLIALMLRKSGVQEDWLKSTKRQRMDEYSPFKVRMALERLSPAELIVADKDWYEEFCEKYTHATPQMAPNMHNEDGRSIVGGVLQENGVQKCFEALTRTLVAVAAMGASAFDLESHKEKVLAALERVAMDGRESPASES